MGGGLFKKVNKMSHEGLFTNKQKRVQVNSSPHGRARPCAERTARL